MGKDFFSGVYDGDVIFLTAVSVVPLAAAIYVGTAIHRRINQALFMKLSYAPADPVGSYARPLAAEDFFDAFNRRNEIRLFTAGLIEKAGSYHVVE